MRITPRCTDITNSLWLKLWLASSLAEYRPEWKIVLVLDESYSGKSNPVLLRNESDISTATLSRLSIVITLALGYRSDSQRSVVVIEYRVSCQATGLIHICSIIVVW